MEQKGRRINSYYERTAGYYRTYEDGNAVRILDDSEESQVRKRKAVRHVRKKPAKKVHTLSKSYVIFLGVISAIALVSCVYYLRQKSVLTNQYETIARMENEYTRLQDDNNAKYNEVLSSVKLEDIKKKAMGKLKMEYVDADSVRHYSLPDEGFVRQYKEVP